MLETFTVFTHLLISSPEDSKLPPLYPHFPSQAKLEKCRYGITPLRSVSVLVLFSFVHQITSFATVTRQRGKALPVRLKESGRVNITADSADRWICPTTWQQLSNITPYVSNARSLNGFVASRTPRTSVPVASCYQYPTGNSSGIDLPVRLSRRLGSRLGHRRTSPLLIFCEYLKWNIQRSHCPTCRRQWLSKCQAPSLTLSFTQDFNPVKESSCRKVCPTNTNHTCSPKILCNYYNLSGLHSG